MCRLSTIISRFHVCSTPWLIAGVSIVITSVFFFSRVGIVEQSAVKELRERLYANKTSLMTAFLEKDKGNTGEVWELAAIWHY